MALPATDRPIIQQSQPCYAAEHLEEARRACEARANQHETLAKARLMAVALVSASSLLAAQPQSIESPSSSNAEAFSAAMRRATEGVQIAQKWLESRAKERDANGIALFAATQQGDTSKVADLLASGININLQDQRGTTALMVASAALNTEMVGFLVSRGADASTRDRRGNDAAAYLQAGLDGAKGIKSYMLEHGYAQERPPPTTPTTILGIQG